MKIGCCTTMVYYPELKNLGFDFIELPGRAICALDEEQFEDLKEMIKKEELPCLAFNAYCPPEIVIAGIHYDLEKAREYAVKCADRAHQLGVRKIGIGSPQSRNLPEGFDRGLAQTQAMDFFRVTAEAFQIYDIQVCIEALGTCYCNFINLVSEAIELIHLIQRDNVKLVLDFYNMEHNEEAEVPLKPLETFIEHVHISDDFGSPFKRYFLREDKDAIHVDRIKRLKAIDYDTTLSIEIDLPVDINLAVRSLKLIKKALET